MQPAIVIENVSMNTESRELSCGNSIGRARGGSLRNLRSLTMNKHLAVRLQSRTVPESVHAGGGKYLPASTIPARVFPRVSLRYGIIEDFITPVLYDTRAPQASLKSSAHSRIPSRCHDGKKYMRKPSSIKIYNVTVWSANIYL